MYQDLSFMCHYQAQRKQIKITYVCVCVCVCAQTVARGMRILSNISPLVGGD